MTTFAQRLLKCAGEDSPIGDLARDAAADPAFPRTGSAAKVRRYIQQQLRTCSEALEAVDEFEARGS